MYLIAAAANGHLARAIADEGGMPSVLWAGKRSKGPVRMRLSIKVDDLKYEIACGLPRIDSGTAFQLDPEIKEEKITFVHDGTATSLLNREAGTITARDMRGNRVVFPMAVSTEESVLSGLREPHKFPELSALRQEILSWRFYQHFRIDMDSPIRQPQVGVRTAVLADDGRDLAAALQTIIEIGDRESLYQSIEQAFPGAELSIGYDNGQFLTEMQMPGFERSFNARELSDGTLRYLCLLAALLSPRPASLIALNEPENSLNPDLFAPLARLITDASRHSQLWITTHSRELADMILEYSGEAPIELTKVNGATKIVGAKLSDDD